jgi:hypothetical protein
MIRGSDEETLDSAWPFPYPVDAQALGAAAILLDGNATSEHHTSDRDITFVDEVNYQASESSINSITQDASETVSRESTYGIESNAPFSNDAIPINSGETLHECFPLRQLRVSRKSAGKEYIVPHTRASDSNKTNGKYQEPSIASSRTWSPFWLQQYVFITFCVIFLLCGTVLPILLVSSRRNSGLFDISPSYTYPWKFGPIASPSNRQPLIMVETC